MPSPKAKLKNQLTTLCALYGIPVIEVHVRRPTDPYALGLFTVTKWNTGMMNCEITISPRLMEEDQAGVLCHEFAHYLHYQYVGFERYRALDPHGQDFRDLLSQVTEFWYGDSEQYAWYADPTTMHLVVPGPNKAWNSHAWPMPSFFIPSTIH